MYAELGYPVTISVNKTVLDCNRVDTIPYVYAQRRSTKVKDKRLSDLVAIRFPKEVEFGKSFECLNL